MYQRPSINNYYMKRLLPYSLALLGVCLAAGSAAAAPQQRIDISDDEPSAIYAVRGDYSKGIYTLSTANCQTTKISGSSYIQYSFSGSGGTFVSKEKLYGTTYSYSVYAVKASAEGNGDGPWTHSYYNYRDQSNQDYPATLIAKDMTYSFADEKIYGIFRANTNEEYTWCLGIYDGEAVSVTKIADFPMFTYINAIAADSKGELYGVNAQSGILVKINKQTGELTEVGSLGIQMNGNNQSAVIDPATDKMYWLASPSVYNTKQTLHEIDLATGKATALYTIDEGFYQGLFIPAPDTDKRVPAAVENLTAEFTGADNLVTVSFTMPSKTFGGNTLNGEVGYTISVDGTDAVTDKAKAGSAVEKTIEMATGTHNVTIVCTNTAGTGPKASTSVFSGFDRPVAIKAVDIAIDGNKATISWEKPETANGGILDESKLSYTVTRNPGNVEVATGLKDCSFVDEIPDAYYCGYSWTVSGVYEGMDPLSTTSSMVMAGKPYNVPYIQDFNSITSLLEAGMTTVNGDPRSATWVLNEVDGNKFASVESMYYYYHDDYMFTAPIEMKAGVEYTLKFKIGASAKSPTTWDYSSEPAVKVPVPFELGVSLANEANAGSLVEPELLSIKYVSDDENEGAFEERTAKFSVESDGIYYISFFEKTSNYFFQNIALRIDDIEITAIYPTPAAITDLTAAPAEKGSRDIVLSFTTPKNDVNNQPLTSIDAIDIYRGSTLIETLTAETLGEAIMPGKAMTYTCKEMPRGFSAYHVATRCGTETSAKAIVTAMSGYLNDLTITEITVPEFIATNEKGEVSVTVFNNGASMALDYTVVLMVYGYPVSAQYGEPINTDESITYKFELEWKNPESAEDIDLISAMIEFDGDEDLDNNESEQKPLRYEYVNTSSVSDIDASAVKVTANGGVLTVSGAEGLEISVYSINGSKTAVSAGHGNIYSINLESGAYVAVVGNQIFKIII